MFKKFLISLCLFFFYSCSSHDTLLPLTKYDVRITYVKSTWPEVIGHKDYEVINVIWAISKKDGKYKIKVDNGHTVAKNGKQKNEMIVFDKKQPFDAQFHACDKYYHQEFYLELWPLPTGFEGYGYTMFRFDCDMETPFEEEVSIDAIYELEDKDYYY